MSSAEDEVPAAAADETTTAENATSVEAGGAPLSPEQQHSQPIPPPPPPPPPPSWPAQRNAEESSAPEEPPKTSIISPNITQPTTAFSAPPPSINDLISQSFINPESLSCESMLDSLEDGTEEDGSDELDESDEQGSSGSSLMSLGGPKMDKKQQRLPLEDFMRKIVFQINSTSDKVWSNLLLDFTKSFAEYQVPYNGFASNDFDLLLDILNIAMKNLESAVVSEQVFASRLLLNINELLNGQLIREKVMPVLKKVLDALLLQPSMSEGSSSSATETMHSQEEEEDASLTISLRFNLCFVLAHFAQRLGFCYFVAHIFPYFERLASSLSSTLGSRCSSTSLTFPGKRKASPTTTIATDFALLDSLIFLLSTVLHYNEVLSKKCSPGCLLSPLAKELQHDVFMMEDGDGREEPTLESTDHQQQRHQLPHRHLSVREVFEFIFSRFLPLVKALFESLLESIVHHRAYGLSLEQASLDCFIQWKDQNRSTNESILQTTYSHYQTFVFFIMLLRDYVKKSCSEGEGSSARPDEVVVVMGDQERRGSQEGPSKTDQNNEKDVVHMAEEVMERSFTKLDAWYRLFYAKLVQFLYEPPTARSLEARKRAHEEQQRQQMQMLSQGGEEGQGEGNGGEHMDMDAQDDDDDEEEEVMMMMMTAMEHSEQQASKNDYGDGKKDALEVDDDEAESGPPSTILVNSCEVTKITVTGSSDTPCKTPDDQSKETTVEEVSSADNVISTSTTTPTPTSSSSFIGKFQLTESKTQWLAAQAHVQAVQAAASAFVASSSAAALLSANGSGSGSNNNVGSSRMQSIREHQIQAHHHFSSSVSSEIFGFFEFKTISCKAALINSVPILFDLYYITQNITESGGSFSSINSSGIGTLSPEQLNIELLLAEQASSSSADVSTATSSSTSSPPEEEDICQPFVVSLNALILDHNPEIVLKMLTVFHKLIGRLAASMRFYSFLVNALHSQSVLVLANLVGKVADMMGSMVRGVIYSKTEAESGGAVSVNLDAGYITNAIEYILAAFLRAEAFLSSKPNWRLYTQYLEVLLELTRLVPPTLVRRQVVPRLLVRFTTTRHIPCRQAIVRCLLIIYLEQFAAEDLPPTSSEKGEEQKHDHQHLLGFDLFTWFEANLRSASKYQQRQLYIDVYAILVRLLFERKEEKDACSSSPQHVQSLSGPSSPIRRFLLGGGDAGTEHGVNSLYLVDMASISCHKLAAVQWIGRASCLADERQRLHLAGVLLSRYGVLQALTEVVCADKVPTIRASAAALLRSLVVTMKTVVLDEGGQVESSEAARTLTSFLKVELMELLFERAHMDADRLTVVGLKRLFKLVDEVRQELNLAPRRLVAEEEDCLDDGDFEEDLFATPSEGLEEEFTSGRGLQKGEEHILEEVYELVDDLLAEAVKETTIILSSTEVAPTEENEQLSKPILLENDSKMVVEEAVEEKEAPAGGDSKAVVSEVFDDHQVMVVDVPDEPMLEEEEQEEEIDDELMMDQAEEELEALEQQQQITPFLFNSSPTLSVDTNTLESSLNTLTVSTPPGETTGSPTMTMASPEAVPSPSTTFSPRRGIIVISKPEMINCSGKLEPTVASSRSAKKKAAKKMAIAKGKNATSPTAVAVLLPSPENSCTPSGSSPSTTFTYSNKRISPCSMIPSASPQNFSYSSPSNANRPSVITSSKQQQQTLNGPLGLNHYHSYTNSLHNQSRVLMNGPPKRPPTAGYELRPMTSSSSASSPFSLARSGKVALLPTPPLSSKLPVTTPMGQSSGQANFSLLNGEVSSPGQTPFYMSYNSAPGGGGGPHFASHNLARHAHHQQAHHAYKASTAALPLKHSSFAGPNHRVPKSSTTPNHHRSSPSPATPSHSASFNSASSTARINSQQLKYASAASNANFINNNSSYRSKQAESRKVKSTDSTPSLEVVPTIEPPVMKILSSPLRLARQEHLGQVEDTSASRVTGGGDSQMDVMDSMDSSTDANANCLAANVSAVK